MERGLGIEFLNMKEKVIIKCNLTESEAFASEAALINIFNYVENSGLTNIVAGHHSIGALSVEDFEKIYGAEELQKSDIRHKIMIIKINKLYQKGMEEDVLYDSVRGIWRASMSRVKDVEYVFGVYNSLIVAVYKPTSWHVCKDAVDKLPQHVTQLTEKTENRIFFVDEGFENHMRPDEPEKFYLYKSIAGLKVNQSAQNPITYLNPVE